MRFRLFLSLVVLSMLVTACGAGIPAAVQLSYELEPGTTHTFEVDFDQHIELSTEGDTSALGEEDIPGSLSMDVAGTATFAYDISAGDTEGTYLVAITGDVSGLDVTGTIDGEPLDPSDLPDLAEMEPVEMTLIVDEQGRILPDEGDMGGGPLGSLDGLGGLGSLFTPGSSPVRFIGPPLPEGEVTVGATWSEIFESPGFAGADPVEMDVTSEITGVESIDDADVFVIETSYVTPATEIDLAEILLGLFTSFLPEGMPGDQGGELGSLVEGLRLLISVDGSAGELTTWFDAAAGMARKAVFSDSIHLVVDATIPGEAAGEPVAMTADLSVDQTLVYRLVGSETG